MTEQSDKLLNVHEAALYLGLAESTIWKMIQREQIPVVKIAGVRAVRFRQSALDALIQDREKRKKPAQV